MKHISAGVNNAHTKLRKIDILWLENGSNGYLLYKISSEKAEPMRRRKPSNNTKVQGKASAQSVWTANMD